MDPATLNLLIQGGTAVLSLIAGFVLRHVTIPRPAAPAPPPAQPPAVVNHPVLSAFENVFMGLITNALGNLMTQGAAQPPLVVNQPAPAPASKP